MNPPLAHFFYVPEFRRDFPTFGEGAPPLPPQAKSDGPGGVREVHRSPDRAFAGPEPVNHQNRALARTIRQIWLAP